MNIKNRQKVALAALLHDIGKFWERGDQKYDQSDVIKLEFPNGVFNHTVPTYDNGYPKYAHAMWTQAFLNKKFNGKTVGQIFDLDKDGDTTLSTLAARHHKPSNPLERIISLADKWSSAIDRPDEGEEGVLGYADIKQKWGEGFNKKVPLHSIFDQIVVNDKKNDKACAHSLNKLNVLNENNIFTKKLTIDKNANLSDQYAKLWSDFDAEYNALVDRCKGNFDAFYTSLCDLLRNYTWCMPSATNCTASL